MIFRQARFAARSGTPVRLVTWYHQYLVFIGGLWCLQPFNPYSRVLGEPRVVQIGESPPEWWREEWTTDPIPVGQAFSATVLSSLSGPGVARKYGWPQAEYLSVYNFSGRVRYFKRRVFRDQDYRATVDGVADYPNSPQTERIMGVIHSNNNFDARAVSPASGASSFFDPQTVVLVNTDLNYTVIPAGVDSLYFLSQGYLDGVLYSNSSGGTPTWYINNQHLLDGRHSWWALNPGRPPTDILDVEESWDIDEMRISPTENYRYRAWRRKIIRTELDGNGGTFRTTSIDYFAEQTSGWMYYDEFLDSELLEIALSRTTSYAPEIETSLVASLVEDSIQSPLPDGGSSTATPYPRYTVRKGKYRLSIDIPIYDGTGRYKFSWRVFGGEVDRWENTTVIPALGSRTCETIEFEIEPVAPGEVHIEEATALFLAD